MNQHHTEIGKITVVDWGTTSLRATLTDISGRIIAEIENEKGIQFIKDKAFEPELVAANDPWLKEHGTLPVVALGMITSKNGWIEVPYVPWPATPNDLAKGVIHRKLSNGSRLYFLSGITDKTRSPFPDVMRGEETQILGFGLTDASTVVLPGTHSKWSTVRAGRIQGFQTFVTGEIFALMSQHAFIAKAAGVATTPENTDAFERGAKVARDCVGTDMSFLTQLF